MALSSISSTDNIEYFRHRTRRRVLGFVRFLIVFYIIYQIVTSMLISSYSVASVSMSPSIAPGDHLLVAPVVYGAPLPYTEVRFPAIHRPKRGEIVLVRPGYVQNEPWYLRVVNPVVEFFTGHSVVVGTRGQKSPMNGLVVKRIIGVPGDTVQVKDGVAFVKTADSNAFTRETELMHGSYAIKGPGLPKGWDAQLPLSQTTKPVRLGANQYYVLGDNRADSNDSVTWGPISKRQIVGKVIFRYWPLGKLGSL